MSQILFFYIVRLVLTRSTTKNSLTPASKAILPDTVFAKVCKEKRVSNVSTAKAVYGSSWLLILQSDDYD